MSSLIGILLDVSGSMRRNVGDGIDEKGGPWARSIFEVINNFIKHDVSSDNHVFAIGFGADRPGEEIFDIIGTLQQPATLDHINMVFEILERAGACTIRKWAEEEVVRSVLTDYMAVLFLKKSQSDRSFLEKFVQEILPPPCRDWPKDDNTWKKTALGVGVGLLTGKVGAVTVAVGYGLHLLKGAFPEAAQSADAWGATKFQKATVEDIKEVVKKAKPYLAKKNEGHFEEHDDYCIFQLKKVEEDSIFNVQDASDVLHGYVDEKELSEEWSGELLRSFEPYIYGGAPLYQAIETATELFEKNASEFSSHKKLLFVLSDGEPADGEVTNDARIDYARSRLEEEDVTVISCLITESKEIDPRRLSHTFDTQFPPPATSRACDDQFKMSYDEIAQPKRWTSSVINCETMANQIHVRNPLLLKKIAQRVSTFLLALTTSFMALTDFTFCFLKSAALLVIKIFIASTIYTFCFQQSSALPAFKIFKESTYYTLCFLKSAALLAFKIFKESTYYTLCFLKSAALLAFKIFKESTYYTLCFLKSAALPAFKIFKESTYYTLCFLKSAALLVLKIFTASKTKISALITASTSAAVAVTPRNTTTAATNVRGTANADRGSMSTLIGILLDVSGSMRRSIGTGTDEEGGPWARSIFEVIDNLIKHDVSPDNHVFAIGFGAKRPGEEVFDILGTLQLIQNQETAIKNIEEEPATDDHINKIFEILEKAGARTIRRWAEKEVIRKAVPDYTAGLFLSKCESDQSFLRTFVQEILPPACRDYPRHPPRDDQSLGFLQDKVEDLMKKAAEHAHAFTVTQFKKAEKKDVEELMEKCKPYLLKKRVGEHSIFKVQDASDVLHGFVDEKELSKERSQELLRRVEPYIYGETPLYQTIEKATELSASKFPNHKKLLFILSDGEPSDGNAETVDHTRSILEKKKVTVVSCFVTDSKEINPKRLYGKMKPGWNPGAKLLFSLSSKLPTQSLPRTIFVKRGWVIQLTANNEIRLFLQVNHPDNMREACQFARNVVCCQEALSDLLVSVDLDVYINQTLKGYKAKKKQEGETCYANAAATVLHLAMGRILGHQGGYPDFYKLREELISCSKRQGTTSTLHVLEEICPNYRLRCKKVDLEGAMEAITSSRPVVARFRLTEHEWNKFQKFYDSNPTGILTKKEINIATRPPNARTDGHAVVLTSFDSECLRLLNSWGDGWADMGFFRVQNADVLGLDFIDVFWEEEDLTADEKACYKKHGSEVAKKLIDLLPSLQQAKYTCPKCKKTSPVMKFTGTLLRPKCPECEREFSTKDASEGNILALNIYLTSLCS